MNCDVGEATEGLENDFWFVYTLHGHHFEQLIGF